MSETQQAHQQQPQPTPQQGFPLVVEVFHPYRAHERHQLTISVGEKLTVIERDPSGWWVGRNAKGVVGVFPSTYTKKATTIAPTQAVTREIVSARILAELGIQLGATTASESTTSPAAAPLHPLQRMNEVMDVDYDDVYGMTDPELEIEVTKLLRKREVERRVFHEELDRVVDETLVQRQKQQQQQQQQGILSRQRSDQALKQFSNNNSSDTDMAMTLVSEQQKLSMGKRSLQDLRHQVMEQREELEELRADLRRQRIAMPPEVATAAYETVETDEDHCRSGASTPVPGLTATTATTVSTPSTPQSSHCQPLPSSTTTTTSAIALPESMAWLAEIQDPKLIAYAQYLGDRFNTLNDRLDKYEETLDKLSTQHGQLETEVQDRTKQRDAAAEVYQETVGKLFEYWTSLVEAEQRELANLKAGGALSGPQLMAELNSQITHLERQIETGRKGFEKKSVELENLEAQKVALVKTNQLADITPQLEAEARTKSENTKRLQQQAKDVLENSKKQMADDQVLYRQLERKRRETYNQIQELKGNLRVYCRVKPIGKNESNEMVTVIDDMTIQIYDSNMEKMNTYEFDLVIPESASQQEIFEEVRPLATSVLDGYNVCIFAYGQTGSGKTYTMEGPPDNRGINYRAVKELFQVAAERGDEYQCRMTVSVLEVYNDKLFDLQKNRSPAKVRTAPDGTVLIEPMIKHDVMGVEDVQRALEKAYQSRSIAGTDCNAHSSRSHCILTVYVNATNSATNQTTTAKLHLIDLAGSERVKNSGVEGDRLKEATHINSSLTHLKTVIQGLASKSSFVAYRNSTLTSMLQDSLGGNCKCLMFANVSAATHNIPESICTMKYAAEARKVEVGKVSANVKK